jgi:hypothetical protein
MNDNVFAVAIELPTLTDTGLQAMKEGKHNAVAAIARLLKKQEEEEKARFALLEQIWG